MSGDEAVIVFDFETTGGSPSMGDRPIEVGAVRIEQDVIVDNFQSLMNPGFTISSFIESVTGIDNRLLVGAPPCEVVMERFAEFIGNTPLVAHNASFDLPFLDAELDGLGHFRENETACSMLVGRRLFPDAPNHKLRTLVQYCGIYSDDVFHRALADAEKTGRIWIAMTATLKSDFHIDPVPFSLMQELARIPKARVDAFLRKKAGEQSIPNMFSNFSTAPKDRQGDL